MGRRNNKKGIENGQGIVEKKRPGIIGKTKNEKERKGMGRGGKEKKKVRRDEKRKETRSDGEGTDQRRN